MPAAAPRRIPFDALAFAPRFAHGDQAEIAPVAEGPELGVGFARFARADIPWTLRYDEALLVVEGRLAVETDDGRFEAGPRDCVWLPAGARVRYVSDDALVFYAIHPANWAEAAP